MYHSFIIWEGTHRSCSACKFASLIFHLCLEYPKHRSANAFVSSWARNFQRQCECTHSAVEMYTLHSHSFASCLNYSLSALSGVCPSRAFCPAVAWPADAFPAFPEHFPSHAYTPNPPPHRLLLSHFPPTFSTTLLKLKWTVAKLALSWWKCPTVSQTAAGSLNGYYKVLAKHWPYMSLKQN